MSFQVISELFQQIVHSEEKIKQRFEALKKVNQDIQEFQEKIRNTKYENQALLGNIAVVNHKLIQEEIEYKWLQMRENILVDQKQQTLKDKLDAQNEINEREEEDEEKRLSFMSECDAFLQQYDVLNNTIGKEHEEKTKVKVIKLQNEQKVLMEDIDKLKKEKEISLKMKENKEKLQKSMQIENKRRRELNDVMNNLKKERKHLLNTKDNLMKALNNDPEIQSLTRALDESKSSCIKLSEQHQVLAKQLHQHQQSYMSKRPFNTTNCSYEQNNRSHERNNRSFEQNNRSCEQNNQVFNPAKRPINGAKRSFDPTNRSIEHAKQSSSNPWKVASSLMGDKTASSSTVSHKKRFHYHPSGVKGKQSKDNEDYFTDDIMQTDTFDFGFDDDENS